jgi:hypothetical protein
MSAETVESTESVNDPERRPPGGAVGDTAAAARATRPAVSRRSVLATTGAGLAAIALTDFAGAPPRADPLGNPGAEEFVETAYTTTSGGAALCRVPGSTRRLGQMSGSADPQSLPVNNTSGVGVTGVDMGIPVEHGGALYILFGDAYDAAGDNADPIGYSNDTSIGSGVFNLAVPSSSGSHSFRYMNVPAFGEVDDILGTNETPTGGFSFGGRLYAFLVSRGPSGSGTGAYLASTADPADPAAQFDLHYLVSTSKFFQISATVISNTQIAGLPQAAGAGLLLWGVAIDGQVFLAWSPLSAEPNVYPSIAAAPQMPLWYYAGSGNWVQGNENAAAAVTTLPYTNQISVTWIPQVQQWVMVYSQAQFAPLGAAGDLFPHLPIVFRTASQPWAWSDEAMLVDPDDGGLGQYIWRLGGPNSAGLQGVQNNGGNAGFFYGAYLLPRYSRYDAASGILTVYLLASIGNPYQVMLFTSQLQIGSPGWRGWLRAITGPANAASHNAGYATFAPTVAPAAAAPDADHLWLVAMGNDARIWANVWTRTNAVAWSNWFVLSDSPGNPNVSIFDKALPPVVVARDAAHVDVFVMGNDYKIWYKQVVGGTPQSWIQLSGGPFNPTTKPVAVVRSASVTDVFVTGNDARIWCNTLTGGAEGGWQLLSDNPGDPNVSAFSRNVPPGAAARDDLTAELFTMGNDSRIWHKVVVRGQNSNGSSSWFPIAGGPFYSGVPPVAVERYAGMVDVFAMGNDSAIWWCAVTPGGPGSWVSIGGTFKQTVAPTAVCRDSGHTDVFVVGNDNRIWSKSIVNGVPAQNWVVVGDNPASTGINRFASVPVAAACRDTAHIDVFATGTDGRLWRDSWMDAAAKPGASSLSARITVTPAPAGSAPLSVSADASASTAGNAPILAYLFDFGDGTPPVNQSGTVMSHTYSQAGTYTVKVTASDAGANSSTAQQPTTVATGGGGGQPGGPIAYIQRIASEAIIGSSASTTLSTTAGSTPGDALIISLYLSGATAGPVTASDSQGNTYTVVSDLTDTSKHRVVILAAFQTTSLPLSSAITVAWPAGSKHHVSVDEFAGVTAFGQQATATGPAAGTTFTAGPISTGTANELLFTAVGTNSGTAAGFASPWHPLPVLALSSYKLTSAFQIVSATGGYASTGTTTGEWVADLVAFT